MAGNRLEELLQPNMADGIDSPQYQAVQSHFEALTGTLDANEGARKNLVRKMVAKGWIKPGTQNSSDGLVGIVMNKIENDKTTSKFNEFTAMLAAIEGLQDLAKEMRGACDHFSCAVIAPISFCYTDQIHPTIQPGPGPGSGMI